MRVERRRAPRTVTTGSSAWCVVRLRTGGELRVVEQARTGVLVEGSARLSLAATLDLHLVTVHERRLVRGRCVRAWVHRLTGSAVIYRMALVFDGHAAWPGDEGERAAVPAATEDEARRRPVSGAGTPGS